MSTLEAFVSGLPKAELHLHIEGSLEPEQMFEFARRNGVSLPYESVADIRAAYEFSDLQDFLDIYYTGMNVLLTEQDFYELTEAYLRRVAGDAVRHVEIFFDPQAHTSRGVEFETVINGVTRALKFVGHELGISSKLIMCFLRHLSEEDAFNALASAEPFLHMIDGVGLDSSELGHPPSKFANVFSRATELGLKKVAHAGEEGPAEYVYEAIDILKVDRIDHGNRSLESEVLVKRLAEEQIALTVCPLSNLKLRVVSRLQDHPMKSMLDAGLLATINSDDPSYFGGYINDNYTRLATALELTERDLVQCAKNSFTGSFLPSEKVKQFHSEIDSYASRKHT